jgi:predicted ribosomally synthesized peptide with SipW-like signal peptide
VSDSFCGFNKEFNMVKKVLASCAVLGAAASIAGLGTFATFTDSTSASTTAATGNVSIALGAPGAANRLDVGASGLLPGDSMQRAVDLTNDGAVGSDNLGSVTLTTSASPSSLLDTDAVNGLQMKIDKCSTAWTEAGTAPAYTYTCSGTTSSVVSSQKVIGANIALAGLASMAAQQTDHLLVTLTLPSSAGNTFQGLSSSLTYTFVGTQRAGTAR